MKNSSRRLRVALFAALVTAIAVACATSPMGRSQLIAVPTGLVDSSGVQAFEQLKAQTPRSSNAAVNSFVNCVARPITETVRGKVDVDEWEIVVFQDNSINAFALPGGKIGVYTGIIPVTKNDAQLGAVLGHEVGHVLAKHGAERMSTGIAAEGILAGAGALTGDSPYRGAILAALGVGAQFGAILPFSRTQESEADLIGLKLMAEAGFNPHESIELWKNMTAAAGSGPPQWLSDHPANQKRIEDLNAHMGEADQIYAAAQAAGRHPNCRHP